MIRHHSAAASRRRNLNRLIAASSGAGLFTDYALGKNPARRADGSSISARTAPGATRSPAWSRPVCCSDSTLGTIAEKW